MPPKVTVYITNHNYGKYIEQAINSVLEQYYKNYELIIIDDGSTDESLDIISRFEYLENVFIVLQSNKGLNVTNNIALKQSRGDYLMRLDADDYLDPHALELMVNKLDKNPDLALVFPDYYEVEESGEIISHVRRHDFKKDVSLLDQPAHGACTMARRKVLIEIGGYDEAFNRQDGYDLWLNIIDKYKVENINLPLFYYRQHQKSLTRNEELLLETRSRIKKKHAEHRDGKKLSVLGIIPVRGKKTDPKSLPMEKIGGKRLIDWSVEAALESDRLSNLIVTTPDEEIIQYLRKKYGNRLVLHRRNVELARINTRVELTLLDAIEYYSINEKITDASMVLNVESPFRTAMYIDMAIHTMELFSVDSVCGVRNEESVLFKHNGSGLRRLTSENTFRLERDEVYKKVGGLTLVKNEHLLNNGNMIGGKIGHIMMDPKAAFAIKSGFDWDLACLIASDANNKRKV